MHVEFELRREINSHVANNMLKQIFIEKTKNASDVTFRKGVYCTSSWGIEASSSILEVGECFCNLTTYDMRKTVIFAQSTAKYLNKNMDK